MMPQIIQFFIQFLEGHIPSIARDADVDGVDPVAEACAQIDRSCSVERVKPSSWRRVDGVEAMTYHA